MAEGAIYLADLVNADNNNLPIPPTITKLDLSSVGSTLPIRSLFKRTKSSIKQNASIITQSLCSSGFISAVKAEFTNNNDDESNANDESNTENDIGWYRRTPPPAPSKQRNKKRVFVELGDDNNKQQEEEGVVSRLSNAFSQSMWNIKNGSGFRDRPPNPKLVKRLRRTANTLPSNSTSNTLTNNATDNSATDTTVEEEEEVEFSTENGGFNNEDDNLPGDGTLNDNGGDSINDQMDISIDEESSPSAITAAVSNTGGTESVVVIDELVLNGDELQSSHFNNTALGGRGSSAGEGTLATAEAADNNVLPESSTGEELVLSTRRQSPRLNANTEEVVADREEKSDGTEGEEEGLHPAVGDVMSLTYEDTGDAVGVVCEVTQDKLSLVFVDSEGDVNHVERDIPFTDKDLKYVTDEHGNIKMGTVPEGWKEWKPPESDTDTEDEDDEVEKEKEDNESTSDGGRISRADYAKHRKKLSKRIALHLQEYRDKEGKEMKQFPPHLKDKILKQYLKENKLIGRVHNSNFWDGAATMAREGKIVKQVPGGRAVGETSTRYVDVGLVSHPNSNGPTISFLDDIIHHYFVYQKLKDDKYSMTRDDKAGWELMYKTLMGTEWSNTSRRSTSSYNKFWNYQYGTNKSTPGYEIHPLDQPIHHNTSFSVNELTDMCVLVRDAVLAKYGMPAWTFIGRKYVQKWTGLSKRWMEFALALSGIADNADGSNNKVILRHLKVEADFHSSFTAEQWAALEKTEARQTENTSYQVVFKNILLELGGDYAPSMPFPKVKEIPNLYDKWLKDNSEEEAAKAASDRLFLEQKKLVAAVSNDFSPSLELVELIDREWLDSAPNSLIREFRQFVFDLRYKYGKNETPIPPRLLHLVNAATAPENSHMFLLMFELHHDGEVAVEQKRRDKLLLGRSNPNELYYRELWERSRLLSLLSASAHAIETIGEVPALLDPTRCRSRTVSYMYRAVI